MRRSTGKRQCEHSYRQVGADSHVRAVYICAHERQEACLFITVISSPITYAFAWTIVNSRRRVRADLRLVNILLSDFFLALILSLSFFPIIIFLF